MIIKANVLWTIIKVTVYVHNVPKSFIKLHPQRFPRVGASDLTCQTLIPASVRGVIFLPKRRDQLGLVREPYGLFERGGARGDAEVHSLRGGDVPALPVGRPLPQVHLALPAVLEAVCLSLGLSLQSR